MSKTTNLIHDDKSQKAFLGLTIIMTSCLIYSHLCQEMKEVAVMAVINTMEQNIKFATHDINRIFQPQPRSLQEQQVK